jgi:PAS domain S-box-containing protein
MAQRFSPSQINFYKQFLKDLPLGMAVLRLNGSRGAANWQLVASNSKASRLAGDSVDGFLNLPISEHYARENPERIAEIYGEALDSRHSRVLGHVRAEAKQGSASLLAVSAHPLDSNCLAILFEDVSALNQATRRQLETESLLDQMCDSTQAILWRADPVTLEFTRVTKEARDILGFWIERWQSETDFFRKHAHPEDWELVRQSCALAAGDGGKQQFDARMIQADGNTRWFHFYVKKIALPSGRDELAGVMVDITDRKRVEEAARNLSARVIRAQEDERRRISRDLHDSIGQHLTGLKCALGGVMRDEDCTGALREKLRDCVESLRVCMEETRSISQMLHPPILDLLGLAPTLRSYAEGFSRRTGIRVELDFPDGEVRLDAAHEMALFRIAQECLTNVQRHAHASSARLLLGCNPRVIVLEVEDQGVGVSVDLIEGLEHGKSDSGIGLLGMRERVNELKGKFQIHSNGRGTKVRVEIPRYAAPVSISNAGSSQSAAATRGNS